MSELVADCPRCKAKRITFDLLSYVLTDITYNWKNYCEAFCCCRNCSRSTVFILSQKHIDHQRHFTENMNKLAFSVNKIAEVNSYISIKDIAAIPPPAHLPKEIERVFIEGASCLSIDCYNATGTMMRLCIDIATKALLPEGDVEGLNNKIRRNLGLRLPWLFDNSKLPDTLRELSLCIKDDGNDSAHQGNLTKNDAHDIIEFTFALLERIYTDQERIKLANERRKARRAEDKL